MRMNDVKLAAQLLGKGINTVFARQAQLRAAGKETTVEAIAEQYGPLSELGFMAYSGALELTPTGKAQLEAWATRHNIEGNHE